MDKIQDESLLSELAETQQKLEVKRRSANSDLYLHVQESGQGSMPSLRNKMSSKKKIAKFNNE